MLEPEQLGEIGRAVERGAARLGVFVQRCRAGNRFRDFELKLFLDVVQPFLVARMWNRHEANLTAIDCTLVTMPIVGP